jgi:hypothetical protein
VDRRLTSLSDADFERTVQEARSLRGVVAYARMDERKTATATRGVSLQPAEHPLARITRQFYLERGRFPTQSETLRRLLYSRAVMGVS